MTEGERLGGGWLVAASVLFWISWSLMPGVGVTDTRQILERVSLQRDAVWLSVVLQLISAACFAPPLLALARVGHARGSRAIRVGAVLLTIGAMGSAADAIYHLLAYYMTALGMDQPLSAGELAKGGEGPRQCRIRGQAGGEGFNPGI